MWGASVFLDIEPERQGVPCTLERIVSFELHDLESVRREPRLVYRGLALAFWVEEPAWHEPLTVDDARVRREHEIGQPFDRLERLDRCPCSSQGCDEPVELRAGRAPVGMHLLVHVRVDLVRDGEVVRRADKESPAPGETTHLGLAHRGLQSRSASSPMKSPTSVTIPSA